MKIGSPITRTARRGFSLIEVMCVVALMSLMMALVIGGTMGVWKSSRLTTAINTVVDEMSLARQKSLTQNSRVEVRFYQVAGADGTKSYRAIRTMLVGQDGLARPLNKVRYLPEPIIIADPATLPAQNTLVSATFYKEDLPGAPQTAYTAYSYFPSGRTDLETRVSTGAKNQWFITLYDKTAPVVSSNLPANYAVIRVDETTGHTFIYRP